LVKLLNVIFLPITGRNRLRAVASDDVLEHPVVVAALLYIYWSILRRHCSLSSNCVQI